MDLYKKILVMGAGAVGGYFGGRIAGNTSARVTLIARGDHLQAIQQNGLTIKSHEGENKIRVNAFDDPGRAGVPDLILFTVKSYDTDEAIRQIESVVGNHTQILTIQNGIENYGKLADAFGRERVIQGFCKIGAGVTAPGVIEHSAFGVVTAGEDDGEPSERTVGLQELFTAAEIPFNLSTDILHEVWTKFAWNAVFNMVTALTFVTVEKLFEHRAAEQLCHDLFDEIRKVAATQGVSLSAEDEQTVIDGARKLTGFETSTYQDRKKGKRLEFEAFTGALVRLAEENNIKVPHNQTLYALLKLI